MSTALATIPPAELLEALATGQACRPLSDLAESLGCRVEALGEPLARLVALGRAERWTDEAGQPCAVLTAREAARRKLEIAPSGRWVRAGSRLADEPHSHRHPEPAWRDDEERSSEFDDLWDPSQPEPWEELAAAEALEARLATMRPERHDKSPKPRRGRRATWEDDVWGHWRKPSDIPPPVVLLGLRAQWPAPVQPVCPGCGNRKLELRETCLLCDVAGVDNWLPPVPEAEKPRPDRIVTPEGELRGGLG